MHCQYAIRRNCLTLRTSRHSAVSHYLSKLAAPMQNVKFVAMAAAEDRGIGNLYPHGLECMSKGTSIHDALKRLGTTFEEGPLVNGTSLFVQPKSLFYEMDGKRRRWDAIQSHASVGVVVFHTQRRAFLLVRQFRPAVYASMIREVAKAAGGVLPGLHQGFTFELCAGILDKAKSLEETASEEIQEELGYAVPPSQIKFISSSVASAGTSGARHHMFYAEVDEGMRVNGGGGLADHGEVIEVLSLPLEQTQSFIFDDQLNKSPGMMLGLLWAYHEINAGKGSKQQRPDSNPLLTEPLELKPVLPA